MPDVREGHDCCDRCTFAADADTAVRVARRRLLKAAVFGRPDSDGGPAVRKDRLGWAFPDSDNLPRAIFGTVLDVSPQVLIIGHGTSERRLTLTADATAWRGGRLEPTALSPGDEAVVRLQNSRRGIADRIWANIGRVTGTILERAGHRLVVTGGITRRHQIVIIPARATGRIQVRFPNLEPGFLLDVIGLRRGGALEALIPATSQPAYRVDRLPAPPQVSGHVPDTISGSATWQESVGDPPGLLGVSYPALDPDTGCAEAVAATGTPQGTVRMPYLSVGSVLRIRNDCTGSSCVLPVTGCDPAAPLFNDRCVTCGTSPRGRVAGLTLASFVALGGELERGCFNATITIGR